MTSDKLAIDNLAATPGILAVLQTQGNLTFSGGDIQRWGTVLQGTQKILDLPDACEDGVNVILAQHAVVAVKSGTVFLGVVVPKGHAIMKSLRRMFRKHFKRLGVPLSNSEK